MKIRLTVVQFEGGRSGFLERTYRSAILYDWDGNRFPHNHQLKYNHVACLGRYSSEQEGELTRRIQLHKEARECLRQKRSIR